MMISNAFLLIFAVAFMGCVLVTPVVTRVAVWAGAIDRPDHFRRIHKGATPRLGGLGLAFGLLVGILVVIFGGYLDSWDGLAEWALHQWPVLGASLVVLALGFFDDTQGVGPRLKLACQGLAVLVLYAGGVRIQSFDLLGWAIDFGHPALPLASIGLSGSFAPLSLLVTMLWFLGCMNIWNLIDGMDGLASGVGLLVSGTLTLVAIHHDNIGVAITASALAGSLAGFLLYNWHPACIFLGDSGSLLIGLLIGVIGVQGAFKGASSISILFPILAMGLPISDTALAIFRRWVRNLPLSAADRRHVHHLLISLGLNPRQAALLLYCFTGFLCGVVLLGVALKNERLALIMGISGCLAFLLILTSRLNECSKAPAERPSSERADGPAPARAVRGQGDLGSDPADRAEQHLRRNLRHPGEDDPRPGLRCREDLRAARPRRDTPDRLPRQRARFLALGVGSDGHFPSLQWAGPDVDRGLASACRLAVDGGHRVSVFATALDGHGRTVAVVAAGSVGRRKRPQ